MKIGDTVKVLQSIGKYSGSPPWKDETVVVTEQNINEVEDLMRAGYMEPYKATEKKVVYYSEKKDEVVDFLPDAKTRTRGRKRDIQPEDEPTV